MPMEASGVIGAIGGIAELAKAALGEAKAEPTESRPSRIPDSGA